LAVILIPVHTAKRVAVAVVAATVPVAGVIPVASIVIALTPVAIVDGYHCTPAERCDQHADNKNNLHCPNLRKMETFTLSTVDPTSGSGPLRTLSYAVLLHT
jgi:hypothetical protein